MKAKKVNQNIAPKALRYRRNLKKKSSPFDDQRMNLDDAYEVIENWAQEEGSAADIWMTEMDDEEIITFAEKIYSGGWEFMSLQVDQDDEEDVERNEQRVKTAKRHGWEIIHYCDNMSSGEYVLAKEKKSRR